jgi:hypothetical protein
MKGKMEYSMKMLTIIIKRRYTNAWQQFYIYGFNKEALTVNGQYINQNNILFEIRPKDKQQYGKVRDILQTILEAVVYTLRSKRH